MFSQQLVKNNFILNHIIFYVVDIINSIINFELTENNG